MDFGAARAQSTVLHVFPFNSQKKRGGVAVKLVCNFVVVWWF